MSGKFRWWQFLFIVLVFVTSFYLRIHHYAEFPVAGETSDEVAWTMLGSSIIQTGVPQSWSFFAPYENVLDVVFGDQHFRLVAPALDHPPLFSLIPGFFQTITGNVWESLPSMKVIRFPLVLLGVLNVLLVSVWLIRVFGWKAWTIGGILLFATVPSFVFLSRLVVSENLLITLFLCLAIAVHVMQETKNRRFQQIATFVAWLALWAMPLTKIAGIALGIGVLVGLIQILSKKSLLILSSGFIFGIVSYLMYAAFYDWNLFVAVQLGQAGRDVGLLTAYTTQLSIPTLVEKVSSDLWIWLGYSAAIVVFFFSREKDSKRSAWRHFVLTVFLAQFAFLLFSIGEHTVHGWYRIVFFPFFAYFWTEIFERFWNRPEWLRLSFIILLLSFIPRMFLRSAVTTPQFWEMQQIISRIWLLFAGLPILVDVMLFLNRKKSDMKIETRLWHFALTMLFVIVLVSHVSGVLGITATHYWEDSLYIESGVRS